MSTFKPKEGQKVVYGNDTSWRSVKDELPDVGVDVVVPGGDGWIKASVDNKGQWLTRDSDFPGGHPHYFFVCPTHWMPIPPLPEGE